VLIYSTDGPFQDNPCPLHYTAVLGSLFPVLTIPLFLFFGFDISTLKLEAVSFSETLVNNANITRCKNVEDHFQMFYLLLTNFLYALTSLADTV
jgi:hypothetical protein